MLLAFALQHELGCAFTCLLGHIVGMQCSVTPGVLNRKVSLTRAMAAVHLNCGKPSMVKLLLWLQCFT